MTHYLFVILVILSRLECPLFIAAPILSSAAIAITSFPFAFVLDRAASRACVAALAFDLSFTLVALFLDLLLSFSRRPQLWLAVMCSCCR